MARVFHRHIGSALRKLIKNDRLRVMVGVLGSVFWFNVIAVAQVIPTDMGTLLPTIGEGFGSVSDISGTTIAVASPFGAKGINSVGSRFVRVYDQTASGWVLRQTLSARVTAGLLGNYAACVAVDGDTLVIAAPTLYMLSDPTGYEAKVFIHSRNQGGANNWGEVKVLYGGTLGFGSHLALQGDTLVVREKGIPSKVRIFSRHSGGTNQWGQVAMIPSPSSDGVLSRDDDEFGKAISVDGDILVCGNNTSGSSNGIYIYEKNSGGINAWGFRRHFSGSTFGVNYELGRAVSVSGQTIVTTGLHIDVEAMSVTPVARFFTRSGAGEWSAGSQITQYSPTLVPGSFGLHVALSGDRCVISALEQYTPSRQRLSMATYLRSGGTWNATSTFIGAERAGVTSTGEGSWSGLLFRSSDAGYGLSVAMDGGRILHGGGAVREYAQVIDNIGTSWVLGPQLMPSNTHSKEFGYRVATSGRYLAVADPEDNEGASASGAVWIFRRERTLGDSWTPIRKVKASLPVANAKFGSSIALSGSNVSYMLAVGCPAENGERGAVYTLNASDHFFRLGPTDLSAGDRFGESVGIDSYAPTELSRTYYLACGAPSDDTQARNAGAVYFYRRVTGGGWETPVKKYHADAAMNDGFGYSVSLSYPRAAVGAWLKNNIGAAYIFEKDIGGEARWGQERKILMGGSRGLFGYTLALHQDVLAVGTFHLTSGGVYLFERGLGGDNAWGTRKTLLSTSSNDGFGSSVAMDGGLLAVGAAADDVRATNSGAVHLYERDLGGSNQWGLVSTQRSDQTDVTLAFGRSVALGYGVLAVGVPNHNGAGDAAGGVKSLRFGSYEFWAASKGLTSRLDSRWKPEDDPDQDGLINLEEFALNSNPLSSSSRGQLEFEYAPASLYKIGLRWNKPSYSTGGLSYRVLGMSASRPAFYPGLVEVVTDSERLYHTRWRGTAPEGGGFLKMEFSYPVWW